MSLSLHRVDNLVGRKVALLICNHAYPNVLDSSGHPVGKASEARHKTTLMDRFLLQKLGFDSVKTIVDQDLEGIEKALDEL